MRTFGDARAAGLRLAPDVGDHRSRRHASAQAQQPAPARRAARGAREGAGGSRAGKAPRRRLQLPRRAPGSSCARRPAPSRKDKDGKEEKKDLKICLTHHERLDGNSGMVLVSAAMRQVEGQDKQYFMVMVPLGMVLQPGMRATLYPKDLWEKALKNEKIDETKLKAIEPRLHALPSGRLHGRDRGNGGAID